MAWGARSRRPAEREDLLDRFTRLLLFSEHRGPYATGAAWVKADGTYRLEKAPLPARQFIQTACYADCLNEITDDITVLMGHTRWPTRGTIHTPTNNHPLWAAPILLCHNGVVAEVQRHFRRLQLPRTAEVDSELLLRLAQRHAGADGLDVPAFLTDLEPLDGRISLALAATTRPDELILLKGNMPLEVRVHAERQVLCYASEARILGLALSGDAGWVPLPLGRGEGLIVDTQAWTLQRVPFVFQGLHTDAGQGYTGASARKAGV